VEQWVNNRQFLLPEFKVRFLWRSLATAGCRHTGDISSLEEHDMDRVIAAARIDAWSPSGIRVKREMLELRLRRLSAGAQQQAEMDAADLAERGKQKAEVGAVAADVIQDDHI
jgi:hypothetical protein